MRYSLIEIFVSDPVRFHLISCFISVFTVKKCLCFVFTSFGITFKFRPKCVGVFLICKT